MTTKTIYLPTVYVDEATGEIIEKEQLKNLSYKSKLITNIQKNGTTKKIHSIREITIPSFTQIYRCGVIGNMIVSKTIVVGS